MAMASPLPEQFGRFHILRKLGEGGMAAVYLAEDSELGRQVALKVPHLSDADGPKVIERFYREARAAAAINHPNICPVHAVGQIDGIHYLCMPYIEGGSLAQRLGHQQPLPPERAVALVLRLARTLQEVHQKGIIHRDLKPANIMLRPGDEPVIMDFGLARALAASHRLTQTGTAIGTPAYMSPEQVLGDLEAIGCATDIYSLGVILYELLTGHLPFPGPGPALFGQILHAAVPSPSSVRPRLDPALDGLCRKALAKKPSGRYPSMADFAEVLQRYLGADPGATIPPRTLDATGTYHPARATATEMRLACPGCGRNLRVPAGTVTRRARCPACESVVELPRETQVAPAVLLPRETQVAPAVLPVAPLSAPSMPAPRPLRNRTKRPKSKRRSRPILPWAVAGVAILLAVGGLVGLLVSKRGRTTQQNEGPLALRSDVGPTRAPGPTRAAPTAATELPPPL
jgi:hypothetical protein